MVTTINSGPAGAHYITDYFRTTLNIANPAAIVALDLHLLRDDGAVLYINGSEVMRSNMPGGAITYTTLASSAVSGTDETTFFEYPLHPSVFITGANTIAVELHQSAATSSDAVFDMYIQAAVDNVAPAAPSTPDLGEGSDSGFDEDDYTNVTTPTFFGTAEAGSTVKIYSDSILVGSGVATGGTYSITTSALADGAHAITATATDRAGNTSSVSNALTVTIDTVKPAIVDAPNFIVDAPRMAVLVPFTEDVSTSVGSDDLLLTNLTTGAVVPVSSISVVYQSPHTATFTFAGFANGVLPDGNYSASIPAANITDLAANPLSSTVSFNFFVLSADANRDRSVDLTDFTVLAANFNGTGKIYSQGDFNYDTTVDLTDFTMLAARFNFTLAPAAPLTLSTRFSAATVMAALDASPGTDARRESTDLRPGLRYLLGEFT
jgi:hypothetical protein